MENSNLPENVYSFTRDNEPSGRYIAIEVWDRQRPDKSKQKLIKVNPESFGIDEAKLDGMIEYWKGVARGAEFENPMFTIQGDIGKGSQIAYAYKDGRKEPPLNASCYTIKPKLEEGVVIVRLPQDGKSLVYHSPLNSPTLRDEVNSFNQILARFFKGEAIKPIDKSPGWEFRNEVVVDNTRLKDY